MRYKITRDESYRGVVQKSNNDVQHHKYIRREKGKNGKWRYWYDEPENDSKKQSSDPLIDDLTKAAEDLENQVSEYLSERQEQIDELYELVNSEEFSEWVNKELGVWKAEVEDGGSEEDFNEFKEMCDFLGVNYDDVKAIRKPTKKVKPDPDSNKKIKAAVYLGTKRPSIKNNVDVKKEQDNLRRYVKVHGNKLLPSKLYK